MSGSGWGVGLGEGIRVDVNEELKFFGKFKKKKMGGGVRAVGSGGGVSGRGGQDECERRIEVFVKIQKKNLGGEGVGGGGGSAWGGGGQGGCERRIFFFFWGGSGVGVGLGGGLVRVDVNEELNFFVKIQKKIGGGSRSGGGVGLGGGCQDGCERRIESFL